MDNAPSKTQPLRLATNAILALAIVFGAAAGIDTYISPKNPPNKPCEDQLPAIIKEMDLPGNGASRYNRLTRQCHYKYFKDGEIITYHWAPDLK